MLVGEMWEVNKDSMKSFGTLDKGIDGGHGRRVRMGTRFSKYLCVMYERNSMSDQI